MQIRCTRAFGSHVPGDLAEVPDGAAVDPEHWEPAEDVPGPERQSGAGRTPALAGADGGQPSLTPAATVTPREGM